MEYKALPFFYLLQLMCVLILTHGNEIVTNVETIIHFLIRDIADAYRDSMWINSIFHSKTLRHLISLISFMLTAYFFVLGLLPTNCLPDLYFVRLLISILMKLFCRFVWYVLPYYYSSKSTPKSRALSILPNISLSKRPWSRW